MSVAPRTLWLVRHGHTIAHGTDAIAGRTDVALSETGRAAVRALGATLGDALARRPSAPRRFASPLGRTRETVSLLADAPSGSRGTERPLRLDARLAELDFGDWEGSSWEAVHREHGAALAAWGEDWVSRGPPNGETFAAQAARCGAWLDEALAGPGDVLAVTHGGSIRALACRLLGWPLDRALRLGVDPACVYRFERDRRTDGGWRLVLANARDFG